MKRLFIIANWKSNKDIQETEKWFHNFSEGVKLEKFLDNKKIIIAPSFTSLEHANYCSGKLKLPVEFAAQNISPFSEGAYTGEVSARQVKEAADYVIVGHSERRTYFGEDEDVINQKLDQSVKYNLVPIFCVSNIDQVKSQPFDFAQGRKSKVKSYNSKLKSKGQKIILAYEPLFAIGSGKPDSPENAEEMAKKIKDILGGFPVLYGGSVTSENVKSFSQMPNIDGVLVGGASLNPLEFLEIIRNA